MEPLSKDAAGSNSVEQHKTNPRKIKKNLKKDIQQHNDNASFLFEF